MWQTWIGWFVLFRLVTVLKLCLKALVTLGVVGHFILTAPMSQISLAFFSVLRVGLLTGILLVGEYSVGTGLALQRLSQLLCLIHNVQRQLLLDLIMRYKNFPFGTQLSSNTPLYLIVWTLHEIHISAVQSAQNLSYHTVLLIFLFKV